MEERDNPKYSSEQQITLALCNLCGEAFEADREHICKKKNSYPQFSEEVEAIQTLKGRS